VLFRSAAAVLLIAGTAACGGQTGRLQQSNAAPPAQAAPAGATAPLRPGERFAQLTMPQAYRPVAPNGGTDEYRCFLVDPGLTRTTFLTGSQFVPQNAAIVHHAIIFRLDPGDVAAATALDRQDAAPGWTCFGGTGIRSRAGGGQASDTGGWIGSWAPGVTETLINADTGYALAPGSQIVLQVHYNLLATNPQAVGTDRSGIRLRLDDTSTGLKPLRTTLVAAPVELPCTAAETGALCDRAAAVADVGHRFGPEAVQSVVGLNLLCNHGQPPVAGTVQHCDQRVREAGTIYAVAGHMHLLGRTVKVELNPDTPQAKTLLDVPTYNFDDQGARVLPAPVAVKVGDTLRVTCSHDATLRAKLPQLSQLPPRYVVWGDGTSDEMCLGVAIWTPAH